MLISGHYRAPFAAAPFLLARAAFAASPAPETNLLQEQSLVIEQPPLAPQAAVHANPDNRLAAPGARGPEVDTYRFDPQEQRIGWGDLLLPLAFAGFTLWRSAAAKKAPQPDREPGTQTPEAAEVSPKPENDEPPVATPAPITETESAAPAVTRATTAWISRSPDIGIQVGSGTCAQPEAQASGGQGTRLHFREFLGAGASAKVYLAELSQDGNPAGEAAVKVLADGPLMGSWHRRFKTEIHFLTHLQAPCVPQIYEYQCEQPDQSVIVMQYLRGLSLEQCLLLPPNLNLSPRCIIEIMAELAGHLHHLHFDAKDEQGRPWKIILRDLKPANVILTPTDLKIIDWGLADSPLLPADLAGSSQSSTVVGTPEFFPPEVRDMYLLQADPPAPLQTRKGDVHALGLILLQLLTRNNPKFIGYVGWRFPALVDDWLVLWMDHVQREDYDSAFATFLTNCLSGLLASDPHKRWTAAKAQIHLKALGQKAPGQSLEDYRRSESFAALIEMERFKRKDHPLLKTMKDLYLQEHRLVYPSSPPLRIRVSQGRRSDQE